MTHRIADISNYQKPDNGDYAGWFKALKAKYNVESVCILLSEGKSWRQPFAGYQAYNAYKTFGNFSAYHFFEGSGKAEAQNFLGALKAIGADKSTVVMLDAETSVKYMTSHVNAFIDTVYDAGYHNIFVYSNESLFGNTIRTIKANKLHHKARIWVANISQVPHIKHDAWQYTWNGNVWGKGVDLDYDDTGLLAKGVADAPKPKPSPFWKTGKVFRVVTDSVRVYKTPELNAVKNNETYNIYFKGTRFDVEGVIAYKGKTRLKTKYGYVSAYKGYVQKYK